jgi:acyl-[acyl-carrier-protein]-phospholipid O-acyltransferase/long-chain-fatty-acid--[acyl-carrier-protein] ligase
MWANGGGWESLPLLGWLAPLAVVVLLLGWLWLRPSLAVRLVMAVLTRSVLWLRLEGRQRMPRDGPVLLVCGPLSYLGWLLVYLASPRPVRFVILAGWTSKGLVGRMLRWAGAIVPRGSDRAAVQRCLDDARAGLAGNEVVCLFAEGCRTADGQQLGFADVFAEVNSPQPAPVVPVCLLQPHGSLFSMHQGRFVRKWPAEVPAPVTVTFGDVLPPGTPAAQARQALQELSARTAIAHTSRRRPVHRQFVRMAARHPFRPCWIDSTAPGQDLSYAKAYVGAVCLAGLLRPLLGQARMVAVWLPPGRGGGLTNIALAILGKVAVNLNYTSSPESIRSALEQCGCTHVVTARRFTARMKLDPGPQVEPINLEDLLPKVGRWQKLRALLSVLVLPGWFLEHVVLGLGKHRPDDLATVIFSSGSTGEPKGVMLSHGNVAANAESMIQATSLGPGDRILGVLPFFHSFGYTVALWAPLQVAGSAVYHPDPRQAREIGQLCREHRCTIYVSTSTFLRFCLKKCDPDDFRSLRILMCGAEKLPPSLAEEFERRFGVLPLEGYGCTELSPACAANMPDQEFAGLTQVHNKVGTVGPPLPGCAARVVHPETRDVLPSGEEGLLEITGANVMQGYLGKPELTAGVLHDGWYVTGDMARVDADGHVTLTGRLSRFAKIGGEMVPLERIEEELHEILGTGERVCAVTCVPDEARGERLVVLYLAEQLTVVGLPVRAWTQQLGGRGLPNLWIPAERDFFSVPELPVLGSGKVNLRGVKELALVLVQRIRDQESAVRSQGSGVSGLSG